MRLYTLTRTGGQGMTDEIYDQTSGTLARALEVSTVTVNRLADLGLVEFRRASDGTRLFKRGQEPALRKVLLKRLANRGRHDRKAGAV